MVVERKTMVRQAHHVRVLILLLFFLSFLSFKAEARLYFKVSFSTGTPIYSASYYPIIYPISPPPKLYHQTYIPQAIAYGETQKIKWLEMQQEPRIAIPAPVYPEPIINAPGVTIPTTPYQLPQIPEKKEPEIKGPTLETKKLNEV